MPLQSKTLVQNINAKRALSAKSNTDTTNKIPLKKKTKSLSILKDPSSTNASAPLMAFNQPVTHPISFSFSSAGDSPALIQLKERETMLSLANKALEDQIASDARAREVLERNLSLCKDEIRTLQASVASLTHEKHAEGAELRDQISSLSAKLFFREQEVSVLSITKSENTSLFAELGSVRDVVSNQTTVIKNMSERISQSEEKNALLSIKLESAKATLTSAFSFLETRKEELLHPLKSENTPLEITSRQTSDAAIQCSIPSSASSLHSQQMSPSATFAPLINSLEDLIQIEFEKILAEKESLQRELSGAKESLSSIQSAQAATVETLHHTSLAATTSIEHLEWRCKELSETADSLQSTVARLSHEITEKEEEYRLHEMKSQEEIVKLKAEVADCYSVIGYFERSAAEDIANVVESVEGEAGNAGELSRKLEQELQMQLEDQKEKAEHLEKTLARVKLVSEARAVELDLLKKELSDCYEVVDALQDGAAPKSCNCSSGKGGNQNETEQELNKEIESLETELRGAKKRIEVLYGEVESLQAMIAKNDQRREEVSTQTDLNGITLAEAHNAIANMKIMKLEIAILEQESAQAKKEYSSKIQVLKDELKDKHQMETALATLQEETVTGIQKLLAKVALKDSEISRLRLALETQKEDAKEADDRKSEVDMLV
ncbi:hypothetical protein BJ741DRAFT_599484 [Chytriomyces cf. hyalinus JEL632]|nr:hypothetical protein BJ741DRAFT_599484 [Chytriomyces cf. hyalinus JEL632]